MFSALMPTETLSLVSLSHKSLIHIAIDQEENDDRDNQKSTGDKESWTHSAKRFWSFKLDVSIFHFTNNFTVVVKLEQKLFWYHFKKY